MNANVAIARASFELLTLFTNLKVNQLSNVHDALSVSGKRPDAVLIVPTSSTCILRCEVKSDILKFDDAKNQLLSSLRPDAMIYQPRDAQYIFGLAVAGRSYALYRIYRNNSAGRFMLDELMTGRLGDSDGMQQYIVMMARISCIVSSWILPSGTSHPRYNCYSGVVVDRRANDYTLRCDLTYTVDSVIKHTVSPKNDDMIKMIHSKKLPHIVPCEWVCGRGEVMKLCYTLEHNNQFFLDTQAHADVVYNDIKKALDELHNIGCAHCDVRLPNVLAILPEIPTDPAVPWVWDEQHPPVFVLCDFDFVRSTSANITAADNHFLFLDDKLTDMNAVTWDEYMLNHLHTELNKHVPKSSNVGPIVTHGYETRSKPQ
jgi:hypothetical protein